MGLDHTASKIISPNANSPNGLTVYLRSKLDTLICSQEEPGVEQLTLWFELFQLELMGAAW